jgi:hypothetical protein
MEMLIVLAVLSLPLLYILPAFIAAKRHHPQIAAIAALNILLGWSMLGWIAAFVWSLTAVPNTGDVIAQSVETEPRAADPIFVPVMGTIILVGVFVGLFAFAWVHGH